MAKSIPLGPRIGLLFTELGTKLNEVPPTARREVNDLLAYVEGQEMIYNLVAFFVHQVPMPECVIDEQPAELADTGREEPDTTLVTLDDERDEAEAEQGDGEDEGEGDEPEIEPGDVEEEVPLDPPPKRSQVKADPKRRSWKKPTKKTDPPSPEVQG